MESVDLFLAAQVNAEFEGMEPSFIHGIRKGRFDDRPESRDE